VTETGQDRMWRRATFRLECEQQDDSEPGAEPDVCSPGFRRNHIPRLRRTTADVIVRRPPREGLLHASPNESKHGSDGGVIEATGRPRS
jgi:hypothetical protein